MIFFIHSDYRLSLIKAVAFPDEENCILYIYIFIIMGVL